MNASETTNSAEQNVIVTDERGQMTFAFERSKCKNTGGFLQNKYSLNIFILENLIFEHLYF